MAAIIPPRCSLTRAASDLGTSHGATSVARSSVPSSCETISSPTLLPETTGAVGYDSATLGVGLGPSTATRV